MGAISRAFIIPTVNLAGKSRVDDADPPSHSADESGNHAVEIILHEPPLTADNMGSKTWASAFLLAKRLVTLKEQLPPLTVTSRILELGAGTGLVGIAAAVVFDAHVILTDLPEIVPNLDRNIESNKTILQTGNSKANAAILDWSTPELLHADTFELAQNSFPMILAADVIYSPEHATLLVKAITYHLSQSPDSRVVIEIPLREAFASERQDLRDCMAAAGLVLLSEGKETGFDDWASHRDGSMLDVHCWWTVWAWKTL